MVSPLAPPFSSPDAAPCPRCEGDERGGHPLPAPSGVIKLSGSAAAAAAAAAAGRPVAAAAAKWLVNCPDEEETVLFTLAAF